jgi:hypothetical protein
MRIDNWGSPIAPVCPMSFHRKRIADRSPIPVRKRPNPPSVRPCRMALKKPCHLPLKVIRLRCQFGVRTSEVAAARYLLIDGIRARPSGENAMGASCTPAASTVTRPSGSAPCPGPPRTGRRCTPPQRSPALRPTRRAPVVNPPRAPPTRDDVQTRPGETWSVTLKPPLLGHPLTPT